MPDRSNPLMTSERLAQGLVLVLPGIEGRSWFNRSIVRGLLDAGVPYGIDIHDWTWRWPLFLYNLRSRRLHERQSTRIAERITAYRDNHPEQPVYLVGHSGGGGMALFAIERLPAGTTVSGAILLGCALSPRFNLQPALGRIQRGIWNVTSFGDFLFVGLGTWVCGTIDGRHSVSAGMIGFETSGLPDEFRAKLHELPYRREYVRHLHLAGHFGYTARRFVKQYIAPHLLSERHTQS